MRIGIDIRPLQSSSRERGIGYYLRGLIEGLEQIKEGDEFIFLTMAGRSVPEYLGRHLKAERLPLALEPSGWKFIAPIRYLRWLNPVHVLRRGMRYDLMLRRHLDMTRLAKAARQARLDVLHLPSVFEPEYYANVGPNFPCPVVQTVHDLIPEVFPELNRTAGWPYWYARDSGRRSLTEGRGVAVAISDSACQDTLRLVPGMQGRVEVICNGVGAHFQPTAERELTDVLTQHGLSRGHYFLTNGGLEWRKNLEIVLRAFSQFTKQTPGFLLVVPGRLSDADTERISGLTTAFGLSPSSVVCPGFVADPDLPALYAGAAALVFPSRYEGFGLPVVEAMRCGCPVLTARNSSLPEVGGDAALYLDNAEDDSELAALMHRIVQDEALAEMLRRKGMVWSQRFSWDRAAEQYLSVYRRAAQEHNRANWV